jgi:hypothetical protein
VRPHEPAVGRTSADAAAQASTALREQGFVYVLDAIGQRLQRDLTREAAERQSMARPWGSDEYVVRSDGQLVSPRRHLTASPGPSLRRLEAASELRGLLSELVGQPVRPARASYNFYWAGHYVGLHTDIAPDCRVTVLTSVLGALDPLVVHPGLSRRPAAELLSLSRATGGFPPGGVRVDVPRGGFLILAGNDVPHHRAVATGPPSAIAALCFAAEAS